MFGWLPFPAAGKQRFAAIAAQKRFILRTGCTRENQREEELQRRPIIRVPCAPPQKLEKIGPILREVWHALANPVVVNCVPKGFAAAQQETHALYVHVRELRNVPVLRRAKAQWQADCAANAATKAAAQAAAKKPSRNACRRPKAGARLGPELMKSRQ